MSITMTTKRSTKVEIPPEFTSDIVETMNRIEQNIRVSGVMYFKDDSVVLYTVPQSVEVVLHKSLPRFSKVIDRAIKEIDVMNEVVAYRIISKREEISVVMENNFMAVAVHKGKKGPMRNSNKSKPKTRTLQNHRDAHDEKLVKTTATINKANPMVDRIMDDDSVEGVIMTNKEGAPILTNVSITHATLYGRILHKYGLMSQMIIKELDPYEQIMVVRLNTKKNELILAPDQDFLIIVVQLARKIKVKDKGKI